MSTFYVDVPVRKKKLIVFKFDSAMVPSELCNSKNKNFQPSHACDRSCMGKNDIKISFKTLNQFSNKMTNRAIRNLFQPFDEQKGQPSFYNNFDHDSQSIPDLKQYMNKPIIRLKIFEYQCFP